MRTVPVLLSAIGCVLLAGLGSLATAQETQPTADELAQQVGATTTQLRDLRGYYQAATDPTTQANFVEQMLGVAATRRQALESLLEMDAARALTLVFPAEELAQFPPAVQAALEAHVTLEGTLEVLIEDHFEEGISHTHYTLVVGEARYPLHFVNQTQALPPGALVRVTGVKIGQRIAVPLP